MPTDWEACYQSGEMRWDKGEPSPGLVDFLAANPDLPKGRVLVPGCGCGHDAREWARCGYTVTGMDIAPSAIRLSRERTPPTKPLQLEFVCADFLSDAPGERFDWLFEHTLYCAIDPERRSAYLEATCRWLKPQGDFLAVHYLIPNEDGPPFGTTAQEVIERFSERFTLLKSWVPRSYPNRSGLERIFWWRKR